MTTWIPIVVVGISAFCLVVAAIFAKLVLNAPPGNERMQEISKWIQEGARAFLYPLRYLLHTLVAGGCIEDQFREDRRPDKAASGDSHYDYGYPGGHPLLLPMRYPSGTRRADKQASLYL